jgi:hypothetical protein
MCVNSLLLAIYPALGPFNFATRASLPTSIRPLGFASAHGYGRSLHTYLPDVSPLATASCPADVALAPMRRAVAIPAVAPQTEQVLSLALIGCRACRWPSPRIGGKPGLSSVPRTSAARRYWQPKIWVRRWGSLQEPKNVRCARADLTSTGAATVV